VLRELPGNGELSVTSMYLILVVFKPNCQQYWVGEHTSPAQSQLKRILGYVTRRVEKNKITKKKYYNWNIEITSLEGKMLQQKKAVLILEVKLEIIALFFSWQLFSNQCFSGLIIDSIDFCPPVSSILYN